MIYLITYDLRQPDRDYQGLYQQIKDSPGWWHYLESSWLISTGETSEDIFNRIKPHIDDNDNILIIKVCKPYNGWLPKKAWVWIEEHID